MRYLLFAFCFLVLAFLLHQFLPWYSIALAGLITGWCVPLRRPWLAFLLAFALGLLLWGGYAFYLNRINGALLATRLGETFGGLRAIDLVQVTGILGGLFAGLGALTAHFLRQALSTTQ